MRRIFLFAPVQFAQNTNKHTSLHIPGQKLHWDRLKILIYSKKKAIYRGQIGWLTTWAVQSATDGGSGTGKARGKPPGKYARQRTQTYLLIIVFHLETRENFDAHTWFSQRGIHVRECEEVGNELA